MPECEDIVYFDICLDRFLDCWFDNMPETGEGNALCPKRQDLASFHQVHYRITRKDSDSWT